MKEIKRDFYLNQFIKKDGSDQNKKLISFESLLKILKLLDISIDELFQ